MKSSKLLLLFLMVVLSIGLIACSNGNNGSTNDQPNAPAASAEPSPAADAGKTSEKIEITMLDYVYGAIPPADGEGIKMINEKFNVNWKPTYISRSDYQQKVTVTVASGDMPDIVVLENPMDPLYYKWAAEGAFLSLNEYMDDYKMFDLLPDHVVRGTKVNGELYGLPGYYTSLYSLTPMIRQDWLDNLGLKMPTNYDELKKVALAFTNDDPDKNGKKDTYGMAMAENINPQYHLGAYWDFLSWYHKDKDGNYIPGIVSDVRKEQISWLSDLYKQGAITQDFALMNWGQGNKEFFGSKAGMFITTPKGFSKDYIKALLEIAPNAKLAPIPPFEAPDGTKGFAASEGTYRIVMLNAKLKDQPEKVKRILEIMDYARTTFIPQDQMNPNNKDFDWLNGHEGSGYKMVDGSPVIEIRDKGLRPYDYLPDASAWAPNDAANKYPDRLKDIPLHYEMAKAAAEMHDTTKHYYSPVLSLYTPARQENELDLIFKMYGIQTKMITGQTPIADWDKMVKQFMDEGGAQMIKEVNDKIKETGAALAWK